MQTVAVRMSTRYRVVIPKLVRESLQISPRDTLLFLIDGDIVILRRWPTDLTAALRGLHRDLWPDPDAWLEESRDTWERDRCA